MLCHHFANFLENTTFALQLKELPLNLPLAYSAKHKAHTGYFNALNLQFNKLEQDFDGVGRASVPIWNSEVFRQGDYRSYSYHSIHVFSGFQSSLTCMGFSFTLHHVSMKNDTGTSFLWEISSADLPHISYLLGTMHVRDERAYTYWDGARQAITGCEVIALETDIDKLKQSFNNQLVLLPNGKKLSDFYKPAHYKKITKYFQRVTGKPIAAYEHMHPMFAEGFLSAAIMENQRPLALDEALYMYAASQGKIITGIEPFEHHIGVLKKLTPEIAAPNLYKAVKNIKLFRKKLNHMADLYAIGAMKRLNKTLLRQSGNMRQVMIYDRNIVMAQEIKKLITTKPTFCAVGAGHLSGAKGVLRLLKHMNFQLKPVPCHA